MPILQTQDGGTFDTASLPGEDCPALWQAITAVSPLLDPLDDEEAAVDPAAFVPDLTVFLKETLGRSRKAPPLQLDFRGAGRIAHVSYWVFAFMPDRDGVPLYALVVHNPPAGEFACVDTQVEIAGRGIVGLSPEQAVVAEYVQNDALTLREQYKRDGPRPGDDREG